MYEEDKELSAMSNIARALDEFGDGEAETIARILEWAASRYDVKSIARHDTDISKNREASDGKEAVEFEAAEDLFHVINPKSGPERALVIGYWLNVYEKKKDFSGQEVNNILKNLGHALKNVTNNMTSLMGKKPALVMQTSKSGSAQQARKKYKLTVEGINHVKRLLGEDKTD